MGEKMTRDELKELIRECLVEIITEGASSLPPPTPSRMKMREAAARAAAQDIPRRKTIGGMSLDRPAFPSAQAAAQPRKAQVDAITRSVGKITADPVLSSIFADTAATTLQEQATAERMRPGTAADPIALASAGHEVHEMFGAAAQNWAALAFAGSDQR
jgi:hypothetical protein